MVLAGMVLAVCPCVFGLDPNLDLSQYAHTSWRVRDRFTRGSIFAVAQTPDGYLWLATEFGLYRFDGVRAVPWQPPSGSELPSNQVQSLLASRDGTLWIGTLKGLASWKDGKLTTHPELGGQGVLTLLEDREGTVWISSFELLSAGKLCAFRDQRLPCNGADGVFEPGLAGSYEDTKGNLWLGVNKGFWRWKPGRSEFFEMPKEPVITTFAEDDEGALLIGTMKGVRRFVDGRTLEYPLPGFVRALRPYRMLRDRDGGLRVGTFDAGLIHIHKGKTDAFSQADGLSGDSVWSLFEDREGNIWVSRTNGLDGFRDYAISNVSLKQGLSSGTTGPLLATKDGGLWIGTTNAYVIPAEPRKTLEKIVDEAQNAVSEGRDAIQGMRSSTVITNDLAREISMFGAKLANDHADGDHPEFRVLVEGRSRDLPPILRDDIYRIVSEALRNAFKHAQARRIEVEIHYDQLHLRLRVRDNGKGIDPRVVDARGRVGHYGMPAMRERAELVGGKLTVGSEIDSGTEIELRIPARVGYAKPLAACGLMFWKKGV
jgi:ligand-binding sensor domain-containing protein/two-component sensor histidine kinase